MPSREDASAANSTAAAHHDDGPPVSEPPASDAPDGREATPARTGWDETARGWSKKMFGGAQSSVGQAGTAVATVIGGALGTLLVRHSIFVLAGAVAYGLMALGLYCSGPVCRSLGRQLRRPGQVAPDAASTETVAAPQEPVTKAPLPPRRRPSWWVLSGAAVLLGILAACCYVVGYWGIGNGFAHGAGWGALSLVATFTVVILLARWWQRSRPFQLRYPRYRATTAAVVCCAAAAALSAGTTLGRANLLPPCPAPTELTVLTSQEDLAAVQAAIPGFEQNEPARLHASCYSVDVTAYAAPTDYDAWRGLRTGWSSVALSTVGPRPDVWIPGSSAEIAPKGHGGPGLTSLGSIASSPLVAAVPAGLVSGPLARLPKLGSSWRTIYNTLRREHIRLAIPDPSVSETARLGIAGLYPDVTSAQEHEIGSAGSFPADSGNLLCDAAQTSEHQNRQPPAAYLVSEAALYANNANHLTEGACATLTQRPALLTAFYPDGAAALNFPFITVSWGGSAAASSTLRGYETDFHDWLTGRAAPTLKARGLRPPGCQRFSQSSAGIARAVPACGAANLPTAAAAASSQGRFKKTQAPAHVVIGIDDSGPMEPYLPQITAAVDTELGPGATHIGDHDSFGIWKLPGDRKGRTDQQLVGFGPAGVTEKRVPAGVGVLTGHGHSADYSMLRRAGQQLYAHAGPAPAPGNSVILLTDGDGYPQGDPDGSSEVSVIGYFDRPPAGRSAIKLYIIAFGPEGCAESETNSASQSLAAFADATGGTCLQANGANLNQLLAQVLGQISTAR